MKGIERGGESSPKSLPLRSFFLLLFASFLNSVFLLSAFCISYVFSDHVFDLSGPLYISF